jgi:hypothetical protein
MFVKKNFTFIVGDHRSDCPSFIASFLSPRICHLQMKDAPLQSFSIETADATELFPKLLSVCYDSSFRVCESISFFQSILIELWNQEVYEQMICKLDEDLTIFNVLDRIQFPFFNE